VKAETTRTNLTTASRKELEVSIAKNLLSISVYMTMVWREGLAMAATLEGTSLVIRMWMVITDGKR
jgi:hypothetical protein